MRKGTGLRKREYAKAMRYIESLERESFEARYQVRVGNGDMCLEETPKCLKRMVKSVTSLRADIVLYFEEEKIEVVEVKERARAGAVGQLIVYASILEQEYVQPLMKTIVCSSIQIDVKNACEKLGVKVIVYDDM